MKRMVLWGACALALTCGAEQQASAWVNFKFGAGLNMEWQSGNNNYLWGASKNGEFPGGGFYGAEGCSGPGCQNGHHQHGHHAPPYLGDTFQAPMPTGLAPAAPQAYAPRYVPYQNVNYGYYAVPTYYYSPTWYGR